MLAGRLGMMVPGIVIGGYLAQKTKVTAKYASFPTDNLVFISILVGVILIIGALTFLPALMFGPIAEHLLLINNGSF